jgi:hypothetical protein
VVWRQEALHVQTMVSVVIDTSATEG